METIRYFSRKLMTRVSSKLILYHRKRGSQALPWPGSSTVSRRVNFAKWRRKPASTSRPKPNQNHTHPWAFCSLKQWVTAKVCCLAPRCCNIEDDSYRKRTDRMSNFGQARGDLLSLFSGRPLMGLKRERPCGSGGHGIVKGGSEDRRTGKGKTYPVVTN